MNKNIAVSLQNISKIYKLYDKPIDRLKESLHPLKKKYHKDFYALKNINLEIKKGEVLGIVGVNGAGKSTLLKIISGVLTPTSGRVNIHGRINAILELGSSLKPEMTGRENIKLNLQINGIEKDREKITDEIIEFADIGEHIDQPIKSYSSGMKARLGFGIATSTDPDVLIVDEVLAVGDVLFKRKCYSRIEKLFKDGKTVIFVSHSAQSVVEFCSRAILLYDREIILDDTPKKVTDYYQKLVFSKDKQKVLDEINGKVEIKEQEQKQEIKEEIEVNKEFYLPELKSKPIEYRNYDVDIFDIMILDIDGKKVNILETGKQYNYQYKVKFNSKFENVSFGIKLKTKEGKALTSISTHLDKDRLIDVNSGEYKIINKFKCNLLTGYYFINSGVSIHSEGKKMFFLNRIIDAYVFKVDKNDKYSIMGGILEQENIFEVVKL
jgi:lipopolysaccharide transport system ATP-binding protein